MTIFLHLSPRVLLTLSLVVALKSLYIFLFQVILPFMLMNPRFSLFDPVHRCIEHYVLHPDISNITIDYASSRALKTHSLINLS